MKLAKIDEKNLIFSEPFSQICSLQKGSVIAGINGLCVIVNNDEKTKFVEVIYPRMRVNLQTNQVEFGQDKLFEKSHLESHYKERFKESKTREYCIDTLDVSYVLNSRYLLDIMQMLKVMINPYHVPIYERHCIFSRKNDSFVDCILAMQTLQLHDYLLLFIMEEAIEFNILSSFRKFNIICRIKKSFQQRSNVCIKND